MSSLSTPKNISDILSDLETYIQSAPDFDIVFSDKAGYLLLTIEQERVESVTPVASASHLAHLLLEEFASSLHCEYPLAEKEKSLCRDQLRQVINHLSESNQAFYQRTLESVLEYKPL